MRIINLVTIFIILTLLLSSCVPGGGTNGKRKKKKVDGAITPDEILVSSPNLSNDISWYDGNYINGMLTINESYQTIVYIRGNTVHNFLASNSNNTKKFCLVISYNQNSVTAKNSFRARAIPIFFNNERLFKIDLVAQDASASDCNGTTSLYDGNNIQYGSSSSPSYLPSQVCPDCSGYITSLNMSLYESNNGLSELSKIDNSVINLSSLDLRIDVKNNTTSGVSSCSDAACSSQSFDCCIDGQCVKDGVMKPSPDQTDLPQALADVRIKKERYRNWPSVYFVCGNNSAIDEDEETDPVDAALESSNALAALIEEYNCLEEGKKETPNYNVNNVCLPNQDQTSYENVRKNVWIKCGCQAFPFPNDPDSPYCPDYGLKTVKDNLDNIINVTCDIPTTAEEAPIQNLQLVVPSRSSPHRFFDTGGVSYDDLSKISILPRPEQEGEKFEYLDPSGKTTPLKTTFSMNAILGQMNTDLSGALPAKMLTVEFDQTYIITALSGFYTPCASCAVDAWYTAFSPHPTSQSGLGLRAIGYTTNRQLYNDNNTNGNYEDTIFGRACWLPPTMVPFSHKINTNLITQRNDRLKTQAALYINGYQRDWFGFNKGAIIGSFDGVKWFAIGKGRRVTATSKKLFLAINAPFADLADNTSITVSVTTDLGINIATSVDYDPLLSSDDPLQNEGGSCQRYHQCVVDSDCISTLGWEYSCAPIDKYKINLPKFDENANEIANEQISRASFDKILQGSQTTAGQNRCVYRGAGAICKINYNDHGLTNDEKKLFTCAPNFHCEALSGNLYNQELIRTSSAYNNIIYGQESDILGRPTNYNSGTGSGLLSFEITNNILSNAAIYFNDNINDLGTKDFGICRPGKNISSGTTAWSDQHKNRDLNGRTDYISQISSCDSTALGDARINSCPAFDSDGNYSYDVGDFTQNRVQNMCGQASRTDISGSFESTFKNIEEGIIGSFTSLFEKKIVADACFRTAGSVCHTNLDCSPSSLHGQEANFFDKTSFGNTEAELMFWQESLVCSQAKQRPNLQDEDYFDFEMPKNRCCREVGKSLTMFTAGPADIIPSNIDSDILDINEFISPNPSASGRYSRYITIKDLANNNSIVSTTAVYPQIPIVEKNKTPQSYQWKTINETGRRTCCGGNFIRKFSDGTHDWSNKNRLNMSPENFKCLNYQNDLPFGNNRGSDEDTYQAEYANFCLSPGSGGCMQVPFPDANGFAITAPTDYVVTSSTMSTKPDNDPGSSSGFSQFDQLSAEVPYVPKVYKNPKPISALAGDRLNFFLDNIDPINYSISFYLPAYISIGNINFINGIKIQYIDSNGDLFPAVYPVSVTCPTPWDNPKDNLNDNEYCITSNNHPNFYTDPGRLPVIHIKGQEKVDGVDDWAYAWVEIDFIPQNSMSTLTGSPPTSLPMKAGTDMYYLTKLGRLELNGIPQITYEPLYCNNEKNKLVEGIFDLDGAAQTRANFNAVAFQNNIPNVTGKKLLEIYGVDASVDDFSNFDQHIVHSDKLNYTPIFSGNEFVCCQELGSIAVSKGLCCSNFSVQDPNNSGVRLCALPSGTNLNVYFNRFVSGEGVSGDNPFEDTDFIPETGELKLDSDVYQKLITFGVEYCETNTVVRGAAFGNYNPSPHGVAYIDAQGLSEDEQRYYSIVDEVGDYDPTDDSGYALFREGFKWNHHKYCE